MSLEQADRPVAEVIGTFAAHWLEVGLLVPTATGLQKSIMDAHASLRDYLRQRHVHDYGEQSQGQDAKKVIKAWLVTRDGLQETKASLYRPTTKTGDPRIWFSGLPGYAQPGNVLAILAGDGGLYVVNASDLALIKSAGDAKTPLGALLARLSPKASAVANELLGKLRDIAAQGFIRTLRAGPTGVGFTLETLLGIEANANRAPDYKGIEIKAGRTNARGRSTTRSTLFSMAPDWNASPYTALELLRAYGRPNTDGRKQVYCTLATKPNPTFGLYMVADEADELLHSLRGQPGSPPASSDEEIFQWSLPALRDALVAKHRETFWVKAQVRRDRDQEAFHYFQVEHTKGPLPGNLAPLIDSGHVQLDFLLSLQRTANGAERARDHGYLFKLWEQHRDLLFAPPRTYQLAS